MFGKQDWMILALASFTPILLMALQAPVRAPATATPSTAVEPRLLIIEAEDLGMGHSINSTSFEALGKGWVTTAGILVPAPWFPELVRWERIHPDADLGIQLDLNSEWASYRWRPVSRQQPGSGLVDSAAYLPRDAGYIAQHAKPDDVAAEFNAQVDSARQAGIPITHLDSHGGIVLYTPWLFNAYWKLAKEFQLHAVISKEYVLTHGKPTDKANVYDLGDVEIDISGVMIDRIIQMQPGVAKEDWLSAYERTLGSLPPGTYLLRVHLGRNDEELQAMTVDHPNWGAQWRQNDYDVISNPDFHKFLKDKGFVLVGWKELLSMAHQKKGGPAANHP